MKSYHSKHGARTGKKKSKTDGRPAMSYFTGKGGKKKSYRGSKMKGGSGGHY